MAARAGVERADVVEAAIAMLAEGERLDDVSLGAVARRLGIRPQSLYAHVDGIDGLRRAIAVAGLQPLANLVTSASIGVSGIEAAMCIVAAHLDFARAQPALYEAVIHPPGNDEALQAAVDAVAAPLEIVLTGLGLSSEDRIHWTRLFLSTVYGYTALQSAGRFALPLDTRTTEAQLMTMLMTQLRTLAPMPIGDAPA